MGESFIPQTGGIDVKGRATTIPVLMVVDDDPDSLGILDGTLRRRHGQDYLIISDASPAAALGLLRELRAADREVGVVMAAAAMAAAPAAEFLLRPAASSSFPAAWPLRACEYRALATVCCAVVRAGPIAAAIASSWYSAQHGERHTAVGPPAGQPRPDPGADDSGLGRGPGHRMDRSCKG